MATTDTDISQLVINKLTKEQYDAIATKSPTELYAVTDIPAADVMTGATAGAAGTSGTVPAPAAGDNTKFLAGDGTWQTVSGGSSVTTLYANTPAPHSAIYSDQAKTTAVTTQEILDAFDNGTVSLVISPYEKYMLVNRYFDSVTNYAEFIFAGDRQTIRYSMQGLSSTMANGSTVNMQTELSPFDGATSSVAGSEGLVPAPVVGDQNKVLKGDATWGKVGADNIDFSTFAASNHLTTTWTLTGNTMTKVMGVTVPSTGTYAVMASGGMYSTDSTYGTLRLGKNNVSDADTNQLIVWATTDDRVSASISYTISANQNDTIDLFACSNIAGKNINLRPGFTLTIIRIG